MPATYHVRIQPARGWPRQARGASAFSLVEVMIAVAVLSMLFFGGMAALSFSRLQSYRDREQGIVSDFMSHYLEQLRSLPFSDAVPGHCLNNLYNGVSGAPLLLIPSDYTWRDINNTNYQVFHPDLVWLTNRSPQMRLSVNTTVVNGLANTRQIHLEVRWKPPLGRTNYLTETLDLVRVSTL